MHLCHDEDGVLRELVGHVEVRVCFALLAHLVHDLVHFGAAHAQIVLPMILLIIDLITEYNVKSDEIEACIAIYFMLNGHLST